ncbi:hypothetical protein [Aquimarina sp. SS2-1]|uniref:hypothetical protein n=1 Tax=Aquimarina besae TaxID=3342247 RepID=UPI00366F6253
MLKNILDVNHVKVLKKKEQKHIIGKGGPVTCHFAPPCEPGMIEYRCFCYHPWEL